MDTLSLVLIAGGRSKGVPMDALAAEVAPSAFRPRKKDRKSVV